VIDVARATRSGDGGVLAHRILCSLVVWPVLLALLCLAAGSTVALAAAQPAEPNVVAQVTVATPDVWFTVTPTSEYGKVSSYCTSPCLTVTFTAQYHYGAPPCDFGVNFYWDKTDAAGGGRVGGATCTTPKIKRFQIDGVTYGTHQVCAIPFPPGVSNPVVKCVAFHVLKPAPKPTPTPKPTPKPTAAPTPSASPSPTASPSSSPSSTELTTPPATALALVSATPTPAPAAPTSAGTVPTGLATDQTPIWIGGAVALALVVLAVGSLAIRRRRPRS
jgi:hypothetical protein